MIERTIFLFDASYRMLGECVAIGGICARIGLNAMGEQLIGEEIQTLASHRSDDPISFTDMLREWADHSGVLIVSFPADRISLWHQIVSMPISPADRYALGFMLSHSTRRQQEIWEHQLVNESIS